MITEKCRYSYYPETAANTICMHPVDTAYAIDVINTARVKTITGCRDGIVIITHRYAFESNYYHVEWHNAIGLFGFSAGLRDIINSYLGCAAQTEDEARIYYMAKVLGASD